MPRENLMMNRREALRLLAAGAAVQLAPGSLLAALREARMTVGEQTARRTLNPHQSVTVSVMAEMIIPRTETPGAADVGACDFIDLMLTEWYEHEERERFLKGIADLDGRAIALFGRNFVECPADQQAAMLEELGERMTAEADRGRDLSAAEPGQMESGEIFYAMLRRLTLTAYYTSEAGATEELHFEMIPDRHEECAEAQSGKQGAERK
jgi:hypothetical protein